MCVDNNTSGGEKILSCSMELKWELLKWTVVDVHFHSKLRTSTVIKWSHYYCLGHKFRLAAPHLEK